MPRRPRRKITKRMVDSLSANGKVGAFWDRDLPGFGVRVYNSGHTTYVVQARGPDGSRRVTLGRHGELSADQARKLAATAIRRIKAGREPIETPPDPISEPWGWRPRGSHPCRSVRKYKTPYRERFLNREEYRRIGQVLREAEEKGVPWSPTVAAIRLIMLTGCRCQEIATLRWDDVDRSGGYLRLRETKTGLRMIPLTPPALEVLDEIERLPGNPWVFVGMKTQSHVARIRSQWHRLRRQAGLEDVRLHDLRHSYASRALALGESLSVIGKLLGHAKVETTARYAHLAQGVEKMAAARVAGSIEANILPAHPHKHEVAA